MVSLQKLPLKINCQAGLLSAVSGMFVLCFMSLSSHLIYYCLHYPSCLSSLWEGSRVAPPKRMNVQKIFKGNLYIADFGPLNGAFLIWNWKQFATWFSENEFGVKAVWNWFENSSALEAPPVPNSPVLYFLFMMVLSLYRKNYKSLHKS